jgi:hypothetical protein
MPLETTEDKVPDEKVNVTALLALVTKSPLKVATPLDGIAL